MVISFLNAIDEFKNQNCTKNGFNFVELVKITIKIDSSLSHVNICYFLKLPILIMHREFFEFLSRIPEDVKVFCKDLQIFFFILLIENGQLTSNLKKICGIGENYHSLTDDMVKDLVVFFEKFTIEKSFSKPF